MEWYYAVGGQRVGPVAPAEFEALVRNGVIKTDTLVWRQGMANWQAYGTLAGAAGAAVDAGAAAAGIDDGTEVCAVSGKRYPRREMIQFEGKWISAEHRDGYFQRMREGVGQPGQMLYGGFWLRLLAKILDGIIVNVVCMVVNMMLAVLLLGSMNYFTAQANPENIGPFLLFQAATMLVNIGIGLGYMIFFVRKFDATPGKLALGLKLVRADGASLTVGRIVGRYFAEMLSGIILFIGYIIAGFDEQKRTLHDRICDTRVIKAR